MRRSSRRGQASVEYMLLLMVVVIMALTVGGFMTKYGESIVDAAFEKVLDAAIDLSSS